MQANMRNNDKFIIAFLMFLAVLFNVQNIKMEKFYKGIVSRGHEV